MKKVIRGFFLTLTAVLCFCIIAAGASVASARSRELIGDSAVTAKGAYPGMGELFELIGKELSDRLSAFYESDFLK